MSSHRNVHYSCPGPNCASLVLVWWILTDPALLTRKIGSPGKLCQAANLIGWLKSRFIGEAEPVVGWAWSAIDRCEHHRCFAANQKSLTWSLTDSHCGTLSVVPLCLHHGTGCQLCLLQKVFAQGICDFTCFSTVCQSVTTAWTRCTPCTEDPMASFSCSSEHKAPVCAPHLTQATFTRNSVDIC